ncbi:unnamed protein product [Sphagnum tenellum]
MAREQAGRRRRRSIQELVLVIAAQGATSARRVRAAAASAEASSRVQFQRSCCSQVGTRYGLKQQNNKTRKPKPKILL